MITRISKFTEKVHKRGKDLELRTKQYLDSMGIVYKYNHHNGIDFIINGNIHMDCIAQGISGSIGDKLPTKCFKYIKKYNLQGGDIYILHPYSPIEKIVGEHCELLEKTFDCNIHILDWNDFTYLMNGGSFEKRKPYNFSRTGKSVMNGAPTNMNIKKFFAF